MTHFSTTNNYSIYLALKQPPLVMDIVITTHDGSFYPVQVTPDLEVENLLALVSLESGKPIEHIQVSYMLLRKGIVTCLNHKRASFNSVM